MNPLDWTDSSVRGRWVASIGRRRLSDVNDDVTLEQEVGRKVCR